MSYILPNVLYKATLTPMRSNNGYVCIAATPVQFTAKISARYVAKTTYQVLVSFGNKVMIFDPYKGNKASVLCANVFVDTLEHRVDIANLSEIIGEFYVMSDELLKMMKKDGVRARIC